MTDPILFESNSPRFGLPLLFAGQAQKEMFVNEALSLTDALLHCAIEGKATTPPVSPPDGAAWLVLAPATDDWLGREGDLACRQSGNWLFVTPRDGMRLLDKSTGQELRHHAGWLFPTAPAEPTGGSVVDSQARETIVAIVESLRIAGIFPDS